MCRIAGPVLVHWVMRRNRFSEAQTEDNVNSAGCRMVRRTLCADVRAGNAGCAQSGLVWGGKGVESDSVRVESARKGGHDCGRRRLVTGTWAWPACSQARRRFPARSLPFLGAMYFLGWVF